MSETSPLEKLQRIKDGYSQGFIRYCGFAAEEIGPGRLEARLNVRTDHRQQDGYIHAGVIATMADHTAGYAAYTMIPDGHIILTIEFKINFLRPAIGDTLVCRSRVIKPGRRLLVCESEVYDRRRVGEVLVSKAQLTMACVTPRDERPDTGDDV
jgi:uncharacterized protein (TIGR00369 family)